MTLHDRPAEPNPGADLQAVREVLQALLRRRACHSVRLIGTSSFRVRSGGAVGADEVDAESTGPNGRASRLWQTVCQLERASAGTRAILANPHGHTGCRSLALPPAGVAPAGRRANRTGAIASLEVTKYASDAEESLRHPDTVRVDSRALE